jgi:LCP family protein required for cell wall assembly
MQWIKKHKVLIMILSILLALILGVVGFLWAKLDLIQYEDEVDYDVYNTTAPSGASDNTMPTEPEPEILTDAEIEGLETVETAPPIPESEVWGHKDVVNILLLGTDEHSVEFSPYSRSDSMIIVSINKKEKTVKLVSLQRGMGVPVLEGEYEGQYDWLTHMFRYGGAELTRKTVETCFRVEIDDYVRVNLNSVAAVVDIVGGVEIDLTEAEATYFNNTCSPRRFHTGVNLLDGYMAVKFSRLRRIDSDFYRVVRQRRVIGAIVQKLKNADLIELNAIADQVLPLIQTSMSKLEIAELILYAPTFLNSEFEQMTIPVPDSYGGMTGMGGRNLYAVDFEVNSKALLDFLYGEEASETVSPD